MIRTPAWAALALLALPLRPAEVEWTLGDRSRAVLDGDSTLRSWSVESESVHGSVSLPWTADEVGRFTEWLRNQPEAAEKRIGKALETSPPGVRAVLKIKVEELKSGNERMERDMREALKAEKHPWIIYSFQKVRGVSVRQPDPRESPPSLILHTTGTLSLAGTENEVDLDFSLVPAEKGGYLLASQTTLQMSDFGVRPPTALFGLIKAHDEVDIQYRIHLLPREKADKPNRIR